MIALLLASALAAEPTEPGPTPGLVMSQLTIAPGFMTTEDQRNVYVHGATAVHVADRVALRTDAYVFAGGDQGTGSLVDNHAVFSGPTFHPMHGRFDPWLSFAPGLALTRSEWADDRGELQRSALQVTPMVSGAVGANVHVSSFFHFFGEVRQVWGRHLSADPEPQRLDETRVSIGLGAHLRLFRQDGGDPEA